MIKRLIFLLLFLLISSCSYFKSTVELNDNVIINSNPVGAEIYTDSGELLGLTPLKIGIDKLGLIQKNSIVSVTLKKLNYLDLHVVFKNLGISEFTVILQKLDDKLVKGLIAGPLSGNVNEILKQMIQVQEGVITKKFSLSETLLNQMIKDFPNIASFYVMQAAIDIQNSKFSEAKIMLEKSLMLDSTSELAKSYLNFINKRLDHE